MVDKNGLLASRVNEAKTAISSRENTSAYWIDKKNPSVTIELLLPGEPFAPKIPYPGGFRVSQFKTFLALTALIAISSFTPKHAFAQDETDAYDPFIDYSEYEEAGDEEADINFFRNGRFLTMGLNAGQRMFTDGMREIAKDDIGFGLYLSYFFDLRFALQFGYFTGSHGLTLKTSGGPVTGDADISALSADIKYYINTQNVTKGLAAVNPYLLFGLSSVNRKISLEGTADFTDDSSLGLDLGAGIEFPIMRNKMYFGAQALYQSVSFKDEGKELVTGYGQYPSGDFIILSAILGVNF